MDDDGVPTSHNLVEFARSTWELLGRLADAAERFAAAHERIAVALEKGGVSAPGAAPAQQRAPASGESFPNFGSCAGAPIVGATVKDLRFYAHAAVRTLSNPDKSRYHDSERRRLALYNSEIVRQGKPDQIVEEPSKARRDDPPEPSGGDDGGAPPSEDIPFICIERGLNRP